MLNLISRRKPADDVAAPRALPTAVADEAPRLVCALSTCIAGSRATVVSVGCGDAEACRLRALGLCEGAAVNVVRAHDCTLLDVRGSRLAVGHALAARITVLPVA